MAYHCSNSLEVKTLFSTRIFGVFFCVTTAIPTTLLNALVLIAVWKTPALHKPSQILLANLALTDLLVGAVASPYMAYSHLAIIRRWYNSVCDSWMIFGGLSYFLGGVSLYTLAVISIDRFLAIKFKFTYRSVVTNKRLITALLCGWLVNGTFYVVVILFFEVIPWSALLAVFAVYIAVFLCIISIFYSMAFCHLKKLSSQVSRGDQNNPGPDATLNSFDVIKYRRSLLTMTIVLFGIFILYLPKFFSAAFQSVFESEITKNLAILTGLLALFNSCVNPILYLWRMKDLRQAVKETVRGILRLY